MTRLDAATMTPPRSWVTAGCRDLGTLSGRPGLVGEQPETFGVAWADGAEVVVVKAGQLGQSEALAHRHDGRIGRSQRGVS